MWKPANEYYTTCQTAVNLFVDAFRAFVPVTWSWKLLPVKAGVWM